MKCISNPGKCYKVVLENIKDASHESCDELFSVCTGLPCAHKVAAAMESGREMEDLIDLRDTTIAWRDICTPEVSLKLQPMEKFQRSRLLKMLTSSFPCST